MSEIIKKLTSVVNHAVFPVMEFKEIIIIFDLTYLSDALLKSLDPVVLSPDYEILFLQFFFLSSTKYSEFSIFFKTGAATAVRKQLSTRFIACRRPIVLSSVVRSLCSVA